MDIYLGRRQPELADKLLGVLRDRLGTIHDESGASPAEVAQIELRIFRNQLAAYPDNVLAELRLFLPEVMMQADALGVRELLERRVRERAASERDRLLIEGTLMAAEAPVP